MRITDKISEIRADKQIGLYASVAGPLIMGTVHLVATILHFSWLTLNYCLFSYMLVLIRVLLAYMDQRGEKIRILLAGAISLCVLLIPMTVAMVKTIMERDAPVYIFYWMIYLYAAYGTVKFILAIRARRKAAKSKDARQEVLSWLSLIAAAYTIQMMEFALIATFEKGDRSDAMLLMQYFTHGAIIIFTVFVIVLLLVKYIDAKKNVV